MQSKKRWWWIVKDDYIVTPIGKRKGYSIESRYPFKSYVSFPFETIYVLKKNIDRSAPRR
jgi:hypothetical protein